MGIFVGGTLVARAIGRGLGLELASIRTVDPSEAPDFLRLSWSVGANLLLRYTVVLGVAFLIGWWHRRRALPAYGVTMAGMPLGAHLRIVAVLFAVGGFAPQFLLFLKDHVDLGRGPRHWEVLEASGGLEFWLYMAVSSYALVPVVEELFFRGYVQARLSEDFGPPAAIVMTALLFAFSHTQYFIPSPIGAGMLISLLFAATLGGYVRYRTGSLVPVIVGHALGNLPWRGAARGIVLALMVLAIVRYRETIGRYLRALATDLLVAEAAWAVAPAASVLAVVLVQALVAPALLPLTAALALVSALCLEFQEKRPPERLKPTIAG